MKLCRHRSFLLVALHLLFSPPTSSDVDSDVYKLSVEYIGVVNGFICLFTNSRDGSTYSLSFLSGQSLWYLFSERCKIELTHPSNIVSFSLSHLHFIKTL